MQMTLEFFFLRFSWSEMSTLFLELYFFLKDKKIEH